MRSDSVWRGVRIESCILHVSIKLWYWLEHLSAYSAVINPESAFLKSAASVLLKWLDQREPRRGKGTSLRATGLHAGSRVEWSCFESKDFHPQLFPTVLKLYGDLLLGGFRSAPLRISPTNSRWRAQNFKTIAPQNRSGSPLWPILMCTFISIYVHKYNYILYIIYAYRTPFPLQNVGLPHATWQKRADRGRDTYVSGWREIHPFWMKMSSVWPEPETAEFNLASLAILGSKTCRHVECAVLISDHLQFLRSNLKQGVAASDWCRPALQTQSSLLLPLFLNMQNGQPAMGVRALQGLIRSISYLVNQ